LFPKKKKIFVSLSLSSPILSRKKKLAKTESSSHKNQIKQRRKDTAPRRGRGALEISQQQQQ
jgi:hypothetical protein